MPYDETYDWDNFLDAQTYFDYHSSHAESGEQVVDEPPANANAPDWQWTDETSPSSSTGPPGGEGCVYPETSSPAQVGDECWAVLKTAYEVDAGLYSLFVTASICLYGNASGAIYLEAWDGDSWEILGSWSGSGTTTWQAMGPYDCSSYDNNDFKVRFRVVLGGTSYQNDFAISQLRIYGADKVLTIAPSGIGSLEGFGSGKANFKMLPSGIGSQEGVGSHKANLKMFSSGIGSGEGIGASKINLELLLSAIDSLEAHGNGQLNLELLLSAISSQEGFGALLLNMLQTLLPSAIASQEALGSNNVQRTLSLSGLLSEEAFGVLSVLLDIPYAEGDGLVVWLEKQIDFAARIFVED